MPFSIKRYSSSGWLAGKRAWSGSFVHATVTLRRTLPRILLENLSIDCDVTTDMLTVQTIVFYKGELGLYEYYPCQI